MVATGLVDVVLPVDQMPQALLAFVQRRPVPGGTPPPAPAALTPERLQEIYALLRAHTKHDFSAYKTTTVRRRIERRMTVHQIPDVAHYVRFLHEHPYELNLLFRELLIGVTCFFRDPEAFEFLGQQALPRLLAEGPQGRDLRVWVPGCSTGEEAYSLAIVLHECRERLKRPFPVQLFATDLNAQAIEVARAGLYPAGIAADVSPARLERYFLKVDRGYRVKKEVRDLVVFAPQNLLTDPPFMNLDLLSCRNVLIYLHPEVQRRLLTLFHYVLTLNGLLFLGSSETVGNAADLFWTVNSKWKVYRHRESASATGTTPDLPVRVAGRKRIEDQAGALGQLPGTSLTEVVGRALVQCFAPPSVVVTGSGDILYIHGRTGPFLQPAQGPPTHNVLAMAREGLRADLTTALRRAVVGEARVVQQGVEVQTNGGHARVDVRVQRLSPLLARVHFDLLSPRRATRARAWCPPPAHC